MSLQKELGLEFPLIQAPMAGVQNRKLALAAAKGGALGSLPCAMLTAEILEKELRKFRKKTDKPINVNFFAHQQPVADNKIRTDWIDCLTPYYQEMGIDPASISTAAGRAPFSSQMADVVEDFKPEVVSFHFGLPESSLLDRVRGWGSKIISTATTVEEAIWLEENGADAVIAQGLEAGGHRGHFLSTDLDRQMGIFALLPQIKAAVKIPVIAAGGIAGPACVKSLLMLGADMVQVGTCFLLCDEAKTTEIHRAALKSDVARHTALTNLFSGGAARGIVNRVMKELGPMNDKVPPFPLGGSMMAPLKAAGEEMGIGEFSSLWSGQNNSGCQEIPAKDMVRWLMSEMK